MSHADEIQAMADACEIPKNWIPSWNKYKETIDPGTTQCDIYAAGHYTACRELRDIIDSQANALTGKDVLLEAKDKAIALLNSMVCGGESHSDHSRQIVSEALKGK